MKRCCDHLVDALEELGVDTVYGVPGGAISTVYDALVEHPSIRVVHVRHETSALFMAVGHTRLRPDALPCVLVTSGPGVTNAITGAASAAGEGAPVVIIGGEVPRSKFGKRALQEGSSDAINVVRMMDTVTRSSALINSASNAVAQLRSAAQIARTQRGPVFLSLPLDVAVERVQNIEAAPSQRHVTRHDGRLNLLMAVCALRDARQPLILVGPGARSASEAITVFANRLGIPVITAPQAKGVVAEDAKCHLGVFGYGGHENVVRRLREYPPDVVVAIGCTFCEPSTNSWSPLLQGEIMIQIDADLKFGLSYRTDIAICAEPEDVVPLLDAALDRPAWELEPCDIARLPVPAQATLLRPSLLPDELPDEPTEPLHPARVLELLQLECPADTVFTADIGEHLLFAIHYLRVQRPDQFIASLAFGSMGSGIGAAVGAKLAAPERHVVAICGDYGFQMFGAEIATCVQEKLAVVFVIMNDSRMRMVEAGVERIYGRTMYMDAPPIDFGALAEAHGARGFVVDSEAGLCSVLRTIRSSNLAGPSIIDVRIDKTTRFPINPREQEISNFVAK
jgi:acetolactate synthase I/II/III large subunit